MFSKLVKLLIFLTVCWQNENYEIYSLNGDDFVQIDILNYALKSKREVDFNGI
jgi:hypothetical protein